MLRNMLLTAIMTAGCFIQTANVHAMAGKLTKPGIAVPSDVKLEQLDATAAAMNKVLGAHEKQFAGGHFINAHSVLHFSGGTKTINALIDELSQVEGAVLRIRFSKESELATPLFAEKEPQPKKCDCAIEHNAWADAHAVTIKIYLGGDVKLEDLTLPAIRGSKRPG